MKTRQGFVSNSSASSFCLFGIQLDTNIPALEKAGLKDIEKYKSSEEDRAFEVIERVADDNSLGYATDYNSSLVWFGNGPWDMRDDETKSQFEKRTIEELKKVFPDVDDKDFSWICEPILNY